MPDKNNIIRGSGGCFPACTLISTPTGQKPIKDLIKGDEIIAFGKDGNITTNIITEFHKHHISEIEDYTLVHIKHEKGLFIVSSNHWLLTSHNGYKEAKDFQVNEYMVTETDELVKILSIENKEPIEYVYNLTTHPDHTFIADNIRVHNGGGGKGGSMYVPKEDPNTLQSKAVVRIIDLLCEGEVEGFYNATPEKSIYFNDTPLKDNSGGWNFKGVNTDFKTGLPDQNHVDGFPSVESEINVSTQLRISTGPVTKTVSDTNVDDVRVTVSVPRLTSGTKKGDLLSTSVEISVKVKPNGGAYTTVKTITISGKCISSYQRSYIITNLAQYGAGPWEIQLARVTGDSDTARMSNDTYWVSYTTIINERMIYPDSSLIGITVDSEQFGNRIPRRCYDIKGLKVKIPINYTVATRMYLGSWNGTFKTEWCDNPAWVYYDLLTNTRYGMGLDADKVDKWALYTIAQYCDVLIDDGYGGTEPRFVCNLIINARKEALHVINMLASVFRGMPLWSSGQATTIQDCPKDPVKLITAANVIDGMFTYEGSGLKARHTVAKVTWNDINDFCRPQVEYVEDVDGISRYGWRPIDVVAYGTTSRGQAHRVGKWLIDSETHETEVVHYKASFDQVDILPGEIVEISDPHYTGGVDHRYGGRVVSSTAITLTIDNPITITGGKDYTLAVVLPDGGLEENMEIINAPGSHTVLELATSFSPQPQDHAIWMVTVSDCAPRKFRIITTIEEEPNIYSISGLYYDDTKFARIEEDIYFDVVSESDIPIGTILPPTALAAEEFQYTGGGASLYGVILSWTHPDDPRKIYYDIQSKSAYDGFYIQAGTALDNSFDIKPVTSGTYSYRVRTVAAGGFSDWCTITDFNVIADNTLCSGVKNLQVLGGGSTFNGPDCEIEWDDSDCHFFKEYKVVVSKTNDTPLRTEYVTDSHYDYTYQMNADDNSNIAIRELKFKVYVQNVYDKAGVSTTLVASNPAPSMAGLTPTLTQRYSGITVDWHNITPTDNDILKYKIYGDGSTPPTTEIYECGAETTHFHWFGLDVGTMYYIQAEPYDCFGVGLKSDIVSDEPILIPDINVDIELVTNIAMTDSDSNSAATLAKLYDRNKTTDGVAYTLSGSDKYIQYRYAVEDIFDRVIFYTSNANAHVYIAYSNNGTSWSWLKAEADHTLTAEGELLVASNQSDAQTNYLQAVTGTNIAIFPAMLAGRYMRLYMTDTFSTTIYELIFFREIVAEMAAIDNLAALSANMGTLTAGIIQSPTYGAAKGILVDLDNDRMILGGSSDPVMDINADTGVGTFKGVFTFQSASSGYSNINDKPTALGDVNATEGTKLTGIADNADVTSANTSNDSSNYTGASISTNNTDAKCTDATADKTSTHTAANIAGQGSLATQNSADYTSDVSGTKPPTDADKTSTHTSADASAYTGASISTNNTDAKCTDATADKTSTHTSNDSSNYTGASIATTNTDAKCTDATADKTANHTANNTSNVGTLPVATVQNWSHVNNTTMINGGYIQTNTITADAFISTLYGDLNQALDYVQKVLGAGDEYEHVLTDANLADGTDTTIDSDTHIDYGVSLRISTLVEWDDGGAVWGGGVWDEPTDANSSWTSASNDVGSSKTLQLAFRYSVFEETPASTTIVVKAQYSTTGATFGINSPTFNDNLWETLSISNITGNIYKAVGTLKTFRYFRIKVELSTTNTNDRIIIHTMEYLGNIVNLFGNLVNQTIAAGGTTFSLNGFNATPAITVTSVGATPLVPAVTAQASNSVTIKLFSIASPAVDVGGNANITIIGV